MGGCRAIVSRYPIAASSFILTGSDESGGFAGKGKNDGSVGG